MDEHAQEPNFAPGPYTTLDVGSHAGFHSYIIDCTGRKIGVAWGPHAQKVWTAALFAASLDLLAAAQAYLDWAHPVECTAPDLRKIRDQMRAAIAKATGATASNEPR